MKHYRGKQSPNLYFVQYIPSEFVESYMSTHRQSAWLTHSNKSWLVKLLHNRNGLVFSCGWRKFVADNTLRECDVCSFELMQRDDYAFNVAILRGNETPSEKAQGTKTISPSSDSIEKITSNLVFSAPWKKFPRKKDSVEFNHFLCHLTNQMCGKSKEMLKGLKSRGEGSKRTVEANTDDVSSKFIPKHPFFLIALTPAYLRSVMSTKAKKGQPLPLTKQMQTVNRELKAYSRKSKSTAQPQTSNPDAFQWQLYEKDKKKREDEATTTIANNELHQWKSKDIGGLDNREEGSEMTAEAYVGMAFEDPFKEFTSKHPFFHVVLSPAYVGQVLMDDPSFERNTLFKERPMRILKQANSSGKALRKQYGNKSRKRVSSGNWRSEEAAQIQARYDDTDRDQKVPEDRGGGEGFYQLSMPVLRRGDERWESYEGERRAG
ncbi:hypothetical protein LguiA_013560 [Lonicera macranthoides]